jgi:hypothetical protein
MRRQLQDACSAALAQRINTVAVEWRAPADRPANRC